MIYKAPKSQKKSGRIKESGRIEKIRAHLSKQI